MNPTRSTAGLRDDPPRPNQYDGAMRPIPLGAKGIFKLRVTPAHLANQFKDAMLPPVFATPMMIMAMVTAEAEVTRVDGRRVEFNVKARDEKEEIGRGTHERMVIDMRRLDQRLSGKSKAKA